jgi:tetratricopeptide (TPR) repeat protein
MTIRIIKDANTTDRNRAQQLRRDGKYEDAARVFDAAIKRLERELRGLRLGTTPDQPMICEVLELLSQTCGSLAGNWRDAGRSDRRYYAEAIKWYDKGNEYEEERRTKCGHLDSYNLLQRLVVRLLDNREALASGEPSVDGKSMKSALEEVQREIERQIGAGRNDSWVQADRALVRFLCGMEAEAVLGAFDPQSPSKSFYESTYKVVSDLLEEGLGRETDLVTRLESLKEILVRKGGLARK